MSDSGILTIANFIGGRSVPPSSGAYLDLEDPAAGGVFGRVPDSDATDVGNAVAAANDAFPGWSSLSGAERSSHLLRLADLIDQNLESLAQAETRDTGKPISLARSLDIPRSATNFRHFATAILHTPAEIYKFEGNATGTALGRLNAINSTVRSPRGPAGLITPWNLPLYLLTWKVAPALATGNTVVAKPSELTPATAHMLGDLANKAGIPAGVLNIVHGRGQTAGAAIVTHPGVPALSFTGSTGVGRWIGKEAGDRLKRVSLELGGKNPFVVFDDADLEDAASTAIRAGFTNQGQVCLCGSRLIVQESAAKRLIPMLVERAKALKIGDPRDPETQQGSLISRGHLEKVDSYVRLARELGGVILCGGVPVAPAALPDRCRRGAFYQPTIIDGLASTCRVEQEEIFGPVVTVQRFKTEEEALSLANGTPYGLAASVFTNDLTRAHRVAERIEAGVVWVNCWMVRDLRTPFGGVKLSGVGREGGLEALRFFTEPKNVCVRV